MDSYNLSFNDFCFLEDLLSFEDFVLRYSFKYFIILNDFDNFFFKLSFFIEFFSLTFLPLENFFFSIQDINELSLYSKKLYDTFLYFYMNDCFFINLFDFFRTTTFNFMFEDFFFFLGSFLV